MRARSALGIALATAAIVAVGASWRSWPARAPAPDAGVAGAATYQCPMHPQVVAHAPGQCPMCGMALARVAGEDAPEPAATATSRAAFTLSPEREQLIGVRTAVVEYRELHRDLRTAGRVAFDPDLYAALAEHREASAAQGALDGAAPPEARRRVEGLRRSAAQRLVLLGISSSELAAVSRVEGGAASLLLPGQSAWIYATIHGTAVDPTAAMTTIAAPDLPRVDHPVVVTTRALPGRAFRGRLVTVEPVGGTTAVGSAARQAVRVRALIATPGGGLTRGSFVDLVVQVPLGRRLAIPDDALVDTGTRQVAFVRHPDGRFEPRDVQVGVEGEGAVEVLDGLSAGEQVVVAANFLIDSESRFRADRAAFAAADAAPPESAPSATR